MSFKDQTKYQEMYQRRNELDAKAARGDGKARQERQAIAPELRQMEREAAREGVHLSGGKVLREDAPSKRSLQEQYVRDIKRQSGGDNEATVFIKDAANPAGVQTKLSDYHRRRLLGK